MTLFTILISACSTPEAHNDCTAQCGPGTHEQNGLCVPDNNAADAVNEDAGHDAPIQAPDLLDMSQDASISDTAVDSGDALDVASKDQSSTDTTDTTDGAPGDLNVIEDLVPNDDSEPLVDAPNEVVDTTTPDGGGGVDCPEDAFCEDFEDDPAGAAPDPSTWEIYSPNCSGDGTVIVDESVAHSGTHSIKVVSSGGYCQHVFMRPWIPVSSKGSPLYVRFYVRFGAVFSSQHTTFLALHDQSNNKALRMGGQNEILMWNRELDDATLPSLSPVGISKSLVPPANEWICVAFMVDGDAGHLTTWVNDALIEGLVVDDEPSQDVDQQWLNQEWFPDLTDVGFGWESYGQVPMTLWYDDIVIANSPIGCSE
jgi:hypothetical protein